MILQIMTRIIEVWPYIGVIAFMILMSLISVRAEIQFNKALTLMLVSFMILGPFSIPVALHVYKELP